MACYNGMYGHSTPLMQTQGGVTQPPMGAMQAPVGAAQMPMGPMQPMPSAQVLPYLPSGLPTGPSPTPLIPGAIVPAAVPGEQPPPTVVSTLYTPGFLRTQIGRLMRVEFLIGTTGPMVDRIGTLLGVGVSYILIRPVGTNDTVVCDIYSIKFVTIYATAEPHL